MCFVHDDCGDTLRTVYPVARKRHRCDDCDGEIRPGERYRRDAIRFDGSVCEVVECARCQRVRQLVHELEMSEGCGWDESWAPTGSLDGYMHDRGLRYDPTADALVSDSDAEQKGGRR